MLEEALLGAIVACACQACQIYQEGKTRGRAVWLGLGWNEEVEVHFAFCCGGIVCQFEKFAAEAGDGALSL